MEEITAEPVATSPSSSDSMADFYQLRKELLLITLGLTAIIFPCVWIIYDLNIALNYLLGGVTGVAYLRLLAKNVEQLGTDSGGGGKSHIAVFIGVMVFATQWEQLQVLPVFLGFLTFKATLLIYTLRTLMASDSQS
ncbi:ATP synthase subunit I [filamentous cyanobacterium LEGE 11480]|uniref:ATP synthase subunit I n=2 Tax=Romeriopsis TaxID=2992131 RepID=A0A928VQF5_9CYAN|nr:ATP synthase subunit I [Romeriopsis navalis LEGE 11480]